MSSTSHSSPLIRNQANAWITWGDINQFFDNAEFDRESGVITGEENSCSYPFAIHMISTLRPKLGAPMPERKNYISLAKKVKQTDLACDYSLA